MKQRCANPNNISYAIYGGNGINVCDIWKNNTTAFISWSLANGYHKGLTIERVDNKKNYEPSNCRWVTRQEQKFNRQNIPIQIKKALKVLGLGQYAQTSSLL